MSTRTSKSFTEYKSSFTRSSLELKNLVLLYPSFLQRRMILALQSWLGVLVEWGEALSQLGMIIN